MPFTKEELKKIRKRLPRGSAKAIANKLFLDHGHVRNVLSGFVNNDDVIIEAIKIGTAREKSIEDAKATLSRTQKTLW